MSRLSLLAVGALAAALLTPLAARAEDDPVVAQRGKVVLTAGQVRDMIQYADPELRAQMQRDPAVLTAKVKERLLQLVLLDEAKSKQWDERPDVRYRTDLARQGVIEEMWIASQVAGDPGFPSDEQVQAAYEANLSKLMVPRQYHLAQIFVAVSPAGGKTAEDDGQRKAADLRQQILKPKADFAAVAKRGSDDKTTGANGGDLGWVREDVLIPPIRAVVAGLAEGALSEPVRSPDGWHIVKLIGTRPAAPQTLAEARETLVRALRQDRMVQGQRAYLANLLKQDPVQVNEIEVAKLAPK